MSYVDNNLLAGETVVHRTRNHWVIFFWPVFWLLCGLILSIAGGVVSPSSQAMVFWALLGGAVVIFGLFSSLSTLITYMTSEYAVTNKRVIIKKGFIRRNSFEILHSKVESIGVDQGIVGRVLGFGTIVVNGSGAGQSPFSHIQDPLAFRRATQEAAEG